MVIDFLRRRLSRAPAISSVANTIGRLRPCLADPLGDALELTVSRLCTLDQAKTAAHGPGTSVWKVEWRPTVPL